MSKKPANQTKPKNDDELKGETSDELTTKTDDELTNKPDDDQGAEAGPKAVVGTAPIKPKTPRDIKKARSEISGRVDELLTTGLLSSRFVARVSMLAGIKKSEAESMIVSAVKAAKDASDASIKS